MPSIISAGTTANTGLNLTADTSGNLVFQTNGNTTAMTIDTSQNVTYANGVSFTGVIGGNGANISSMNASNLTSGTVANARTTAASANGASTIVLRDSNGSFAGNVVTGTSGSFTSVSGNGSALTGISASNISSGTLAAARLPTGSVLQVVSTFDNTQYTFNSGSAGQTTYYSISGLTVNITPTSGTSRILVMATCAVGQVGNNYNNFLRLVRGATNIAAGNSSGFSAGAVGGFRASDSSALGCIAMHFLDSPSTTSPLTYSVFICNSGGSVASYINRPAQYTGWEQTGSSTITVMEIAA